MDDDRSFVSSLLARVLGDFAELGVNFRTTSGPWALMGKFSDENIGEFIVKMRCVVKQGNASKVINFLSLLPLCLAPLMVGLLASCAPKGAELLTHRNVASPGLVTRVAQAQDFLSINSLLLVPLVVGDSAKGIEKSSMDSNLEAAVGRELGDDILKSRERFPKSVVRSAAEALALARQAGADGVIFTSIDRYKERVGSRLGVTEPASLGFSIVVLRSRDSKEIWGGTYSYQDQPLSDNILAIKQSLEHPGWKSVQDLFNIGLQDALRDFSERRVGQFSTNSKQG